MMKAVLKPPLVQHVNIYWMPPEAMTAGPGTWFCCTSSHWLQSIDPACPYGPPTFRQISTSSQLGVACKRSEDGLNPLIQVISNDIRQDGPQYRPLWKTAHDWMPVGYNSIQHRSVCLALQPFPVPSTECTHPSHGSWRVLGKTVSKVLLKST